MSGKKGCLRAVLITEYKFDVANDGANASKKDFNLVWHIDDVTITIYGDEHISQEKLW